MYYLSIITVAYNNKDGLIRTRDSILPLPDNCEWIIIDAASNDGTKEEVLEALPKQDNIRWISEPDKGIFDGMNKGIDLAKGKYLNFMNSGDFYNRSAFIEVANSEPDDADIMVYDYLPLSESLESAPARSFVKQIEKIREYDCIPHQSTLISKKTFNKIGYYDLSYSCAADYAFFANAYISNIVFKFDDNIELSYFVQDGISSGLRLSLTIGLENMKIQKKYFKNYSLKLFFVYMSKFLISFVPKNKNIYSFLRNNLLPKKPKV